MATKLKVLSEYIGRGMHFPVGTVLEADDALALFLLADAPGCFEEMTDETQEMAAIDAPPKDKMVRAPKGKK